MRARIKRTANIVQIPSEFATLEQITQDGEFVYKVRYRIDPTKAVRAKALKVKISAALRPAVKQTVSTFTNFNPGLLTKRLLTRSVAIKEIVRQKGSDRFFTFLSDVTKNIPNNSTTNLVKSTFDNQHILTKIRKVRPALISELQNKNLNLPTLDQNFNRNTETDKNISSADIRTAAIGLLFNHQIDPASFVGEKTNNIRSAVHASDGTITKRGSSKTNKISVGNLLVGTLLNNRKYSNQSQVAIGSHMNVLTTEEASWIEIEETLHIPIGDLATDEFYFIFELLDNNGVFVQTLTRAIPHSKNVRMLQIPVIAPSVSAIPISKLGKIVLNIKQNDLNATAVQILRKVVRIGSPNVDAQYDLVGNFDIEAGLGFRKIEDVFASTNPVIYRVIPVNSNGTLGAEFSSVVVTQRPELPGNNRKFQRHPYFLTLAHETKENSIIISVQDIPAGAIAIKLRRKDRSINQQIFSNIGDIVLNEGDTNAPTVFEDKTVLKGRIYEYTIVLIFPNGAEEIGANNLLIEFNPPTANILELNISDPEIEKSGDDIDVTFSIKKNVIQKDGDLIKTFLAEQGLSAQYQDQVLANRETLQNLFAVKITRTNLSTGAEEDFGIIDSPNFSDKKFGRMKAVTPLQSGFAYTYSAVAYARDTETLFKTLNRTINVRTNVSFDFTPSKWHHPLMLSDGTISTESSRKRNHSKSTFTFGNVADIKKINVSLADIMPSVNSGKASIFGGNKIFIQWKVQGNVNKIDHFIIILDILGIRAVVGKSHNVTNSNYFQFIDELTNKECGELTYFIVPVFFDYSRGPELQTNSVII